MKNNKTLIVFDLETGGLDYKRHEVIEVAAKAYNPITYEPLPDGEFVSLMKPLNMDNLEEGALKVNKKTKAELEQAPEQKIVWNNFIQWVNRYNKSGKGWDAPIACGKNIRNFDLKFVEVLNKLHGPKKEDTVLFSDRMTIDLEDFLFYWFDGSNELENLKMDTLRTYFNLSTEGAHSALVDVLQEGQLIMKFLKLHQELNRRLLPDGKKLIKWK